MVEDNIKKPYEKQHHDYDFRHAKKHIKVGDQVLSSIK